MQKESKNHKKKWKKHFLIILGASSQNPYIEFFGPDSPLEAAACFGRHILQHTSIKPTLSYTSPVNLSPHIFDM